MSITTVTTKGQHTIPEEVRSILNIHAGDKIMYTKTNPKIGSATFQIIHTENVVDRLYGSLKPKIKYEDFKVVREKAGLLLAKKYGLAK